MELLCALVIVLPFAVLLWLLYGPDRTSGRRLARCRACGEVLERGLARCPQCRLTRDEAAEVDDLGAALRRLDDFRAAGALDEAASTRLRNHILSRRRVLWSVPDPEPAPPRAHAPAPLVLAVEEPAPPAPTVPLILAEVVSPAPAPEVVVSAPAAPEPIAPRRSLAEWLAAFMEERNILWGELVGGLLVVGCSVALVLSLWQTLEHIPLFPFLVLLSVTAGLFGIGQYTLRKWRLESTSRGLLVIATLLVPLNFLVLAGLSPESHTAWELAVKLAAIPLFAWLVSRAGVVLLPAADAVPLTAAVLGAAVSPLAMPRLLDAPEPAAVTLLALAAWPVAAQALGVGRAAGRRGLDFDDRSAIALLGVTGLAAFPLALALGFLGWWVVSQGGDAGRTRELLAIPVALAGVPALCAGLLVARRMNDLPSERTGLLAAVGTGVALTGTLALLTALAFAWPRPMPLLAVGLLDAIALIAVALAFRLPPAHGVALPCLAAAYLAGYHLVAGVPTELERADLSGWLVRQTFTGEGGTVLLGLATIWALAADRLRVCARPAEAVYYALGAGVVMLLSLALAGIEAISEPARAAAVAGWAAAGCLAAGRRWRLTWLRQAGAVLLVGATAAALHWQWPGMWGRWGAVLAGEALLLSVWSGAGRPAAVLAAALAVLLSVIDPAELRTAWPTLTAALLAAAAAVQAGRTYFDGWTWLGSGFVLAGAAHVVLLRLDPQPALPWLTVLLSHATLTLPAALALGRWRHWTARTVFGRPLLQSALLTTIAAIPVALMGLSLETLRPLSIAAAWAAALWLAVAVVRRRPGWFTMFQAATSAAVLCQVAARLSFADLTAPAGARRFGLGLAALAVIWAGLRATVGRWRVARKVFDAPWPALDRLLLGALVLGQLGFVAALVAPGVFAELLPPGTVAADAVWQTHAQTLDPAAWLALVALTVALIVSLWGERSAWRAAAVRLGLTLAAVTVPLLAAGWFAVEVATASALRWGLAAVFLLGSAALWPRRRSGDRAVRTTLVVAGAVPVVLLTLVTAALVLLGRPQGGPAAGSPFVEIGMLWSHGLPLGLVAAGFVGHALRERSPGFAFAGGLVVNLIVAGGYALAVATAGRPFDEVVWVHLLQRFAVAASAWAIAWFVVAEWLRRRDPAFGRATHAPLWRVQHALGIAANVVLLGTAAYALTMPESGSFPPPTAWTDAAGRWPGWLALATTLAAALCRGRVPARLPLLGSLGFVALAACLLADRGEGWGYRILLLGGAACVAGGAVPALRPSRRRGGNPAPWVAAVALVVAVLAVKAALAHGDRLPAALALALVAVGVGGVGLRRGWDEWVFLAGLAGQVAASLVVWDRFAGVPLTDWWVPLLQVNGFVAAAVALVWNRSRGGDAARVTLAEVQLALVALVQVVLLGLTAVMLVARPELAAEPWPAQAGEWAGGVSLLAALAAWLMAAPRLGRRWPAGVGTAAGVLVGAWLACAVTRWDGAGWRTLHVLAAAWTVAGGLILWRGRVDRAVSVSIFAGLLALLALRGAEADPLRPFAPALTALAASGLLGGLAARERRPAFVAASGLAFALAGLVVWIDTGPQTAAGFAAATVFGLSASAAVWAGCDRPLSLAYRRPAALVGVVILAGLAALGLASPADADVAGPLTWAAWGATVLALAGGWRDRAADGPPALYAAGLTGVALALLETGWTDAAFVRGGTVALAAFVLLAEVAARLGRVALAWWFDEPTEPRSSAVLPWFTPTQVALGGAAVVLSAGVALGGGAAMERLAGPLAAGLVLAAAVLAADRTPGRAGTVLIHTTFALGALVLADLGWALLDPRAKALALRRGVVLLGALAAATVSTSFGLARRLPAGERWATAARRAGPILGLLGATVLVVVVALEGMAYNPETKTTPLGPAEIVLVIAALVGLMAAAVVFALRPWTDPFGLSERRRPLYAYGTELLLVLLFLHLRFTVPWIFPPITGAAWTFVVMAIAFLGVGLSELFRRRGLEVLAGPLRRTGLFLPLLPLLVFWLVPPAAVRAALVDWFPGSVPLLNYLDRMPRRFDVYASLWFLFGLLYLGLAVTRRSYWYSLAAALAANIGLWALLFHGGVAFLTHPQLWLIPLALIVLASEHHHRPRLAPEASVGLRYLGLGMLYVSSTADLFIAGLGNSVVLPLALAVLSVLGVLAGILLRVRSYLYLGAGFLALVVFSMIWHAAVDRAQTWVWWASGVLLGLAILALFALFEQRRPRVLQALDEFRAWR